MKILTLLLKYGSDIDAEDNRGRTALMYAVWFERRSMVELLLQKGAKTTVKPRLEGDMMTPLHRASGYGNVEITRLLLNHGADSKARDSEGMTPLQLAERMGNTEVVQLLKSKENDENHSNSSDTCAA
jgi:ankyrin repeat protein